MANSTNNDDLGDVSVDELSNTTVLNLEREMQMTPYGHPYMARKIPSNAFPTRGAPPRVVRQIVSDELLLNTNPRMNLASFVTTYMEPEAEELVIAAMRTNYIDMDEYPATTMMNNRCVNMLADLYHAPLDVNEEGTGTSCVGSSEAIMLAGLAQLWKWRALRKAKNLPAEKPNIVFGSNVQVVWHKFCRYWQVEAREAPCSVDGLVLTADRARPLIDENTIGVVAILGSTYNGEYENVQEIHDMVVEVNAANDWKVPIHVDAASGGFIAPFCTPDLVWDFRLPNVKSINASGHKFGLVYAGIGWALWREKSDLPEDLVFHVDYLGGDQSSFTLNFSKGAGPIVGQYYNFIRLGFEGYKAVMQNGMSVAQHFRDRLLGCGLFNINDNGEMPLVAWSLKDSEEYSVFDIQSQLQRRGWVVPAYTAPPGAESLKLLRVVVKQNFTHDLADMLFGDIIAACGYLSASHKATVELMDNVSSKPLSHEELKMHHEHRMERIIDAAIKATHKQFDDLPKDSKTPALKNEVENAIKSMTRVNEDRKREARPHC